MRVTKKTLRSGPSHPLKTVSSVYWLESMFIRLFALARISDERAALKVTRLLTRLLSQNTRIFQSR